MKLSLTQNHILHFLIIILFISCNNDNPEEKLLKQAQDSLVIGKPEVALNFLASIQNPERMDKESYMQYIVTLVGSKYETKAGITGDTLILEAQRYFNEKRKSEYAPLANYYAAQLYDESGNYPKALESYLFTVYTATKSNNDLLAGKSFNNIGYIYFEQELLDSAIINYQKALLHYDKVENIDQRKLKTLTNIGRSFEEKNKLDSAYFYFDRSLSLAKETQNEEYIFHALKNLGTVCIKKADYDKAVNYLESALILNFSDKTEVKKIQLALLKIYNQKGDLKSAKQYADLVTENLPEVSYIYTIKGIYSSLSDYYQQTGDYRKALEYRNLEKVTKEQIEQAQITESLLAADKNFYLVKTKRESEAFRSDALFVFIIVTSAFCILLVFFLLGRRNHKKDKAELKFYADKYDELRQSLYAHTDEYPKIEAEIKAMLEDD